MTYVLSKQTRRDLTKSDRAIAAAKAEDLIAALRAEAKQRQKGSGGDKKSAKAKSVQEGFPEPIPESQTKLQTRDQLGALVGVSGRAVDCARKVLKDGAPGCTFDRLTRTAGARMLPFTELAEANAVSTPQRPKKYPNKKMPAELREKLLASARALLALKAERDSWVKTALALELAEVKKPPG